MNFNSSGVVAWDSSVTGRSGQTVVLTLNNDYPAHLGTIMTCPRRDRERKDLRQLVKGHCDESQCQWLIGALKEERYANVKVRLVWLLIGLFWGLQRKDGGRLWWINWGSFIHGFKGHFVFILFVILVAYFDYRLSDKKKGWFITGKPIISFDIGLEN